MMGVIGPISKDRTAIAAIVTLVLSWVVAVQDPVARWELRLTEWLNGAPDAVAAVLSVPMQLGTLGAVYVVALVLLAVRRDLVLAAGTVVVGTGAWLAAKVIKDVVGRERPLVFLPDLDVRDGKGDGLGYVSGHSAVAAALAVMVMPALPPPLRPLAVVLAAVVGVARIVVGVHFPADVVGGWSVGVLLGVAGQWVISRPRG